MIDDPILRDAIREARERGWLRELAVFLVMFAAFVALFFVLGPPA